ncbi:MULTISPECIES: glycosyltransferase family 2 protein [unclassified Clostridium]|uniref:tetratricopeptide repeat-containing glycosyltransferase family 2 protein n=1 Tax=unclassified Clostridium TaxID=2614128 RepID=UPI001D775BE9|nr:MULTISPECIES: glycosyltransferase family 2 protein [unclassified Clostridium]MBN1044484.1 glycosyltransferase family 2 protein [Clostridium botulinum]
MKLSIAMIVKDEEKNIERTLIPLKKLNNYVDTEIVIIDTGSTDETVTIAKKYTNKIYFHKWNDNFAEMRNLSISYCNGDWILIIDADEVLYDIEELGTLMSNNQINKFNSLFIKLINFNNSIENSIENGIISPLIRIFKNGSISYKGIIHEQVVNKEPIATTDIRFIHYGYNNNDYELMEYKFKRNLTLLLKQLEEEPQNIYTNFQIASSYMMHKEPILALKYIKISYINVPKHDIAKYLYVLDKYCFILYSLKKYEELVVIGKELIKYCDDFIDGYFYLGEAHNNLKNYKLSIENFEKYIDLHNKLKKRYNMSNKFMTINTMNFKERVLFNLASCHFYIKDYKTALNLILKIEDENFLKENFLLIFRIVLDGKIWNKFNVLSDFIDKHNYGKILICLHKDMMKEDLLALDNVTISTNLAMMVEIVKYFKENGNINSNYLEFIKDDLRENEILNSIYVYYALKYNIKEIKYFIKYGRDKMEEILVGLCSTFYDFNNILEKGLNEFNEYTLYDKSIKTTIQKALLLSGNLPEHKKKKIFLDYISDKYYCIIKTYNKEDVSEISWLLSSEEEFILKFKNTLYYKYEDTLEYLRAIKKSLNIEKSYSDYIKILSKEIEEPIKKELKLMLPQLILSVENLINSERYQEAYNTIEETLKLIKFDFDIMRIKLELLLFFDYSEEAAECLKELILYGEDKKINKLLLKYF